MLQNPKGLINFFKDFKFQIYPYSFSFFQGYYCHSIYFPYFHHLLRKWRRLMKRFDLTKLKYNHLFKVVVILANFLHRRGMDFRFEVKGEQMPNLANHGWDEYL